MFSATSRSARETAGLALLATPVIFLNGVLAAAHSAIDGIGWVVLLAATALHRMGVGPAAALVDWMRRLRARADDDRSAATTLMASAWATLWGVRSVVRPRQWASHTVLGGVGRLLRSPLMAVADFGGALASTQPTQRWVIAAGRLVSRLIHRLSPPGVLPRAVGDLAVARIHYGFLVMFLSGSQALKLNFQGMIGGCLALLFGDPDWLADGMERMRGYGEYVAEKERHGELGPRSQMPFSRAMVQDAIAVVETYPADVVATLRTSGFFDGARAYWSNRARMHRMIALYFPFSHHTLSVVGKFFMRGLFDAPDAQRTTLCELAVIAGPLPDDEKDRALLDVQATAPASIIEFEHYVPLVVPWDGSPAERAIRSTASGRPIDTHAVAPSIFDRHSVHVAQSTNAEACALRTLLWLFRDVARAQEVNERETVRKFGLAAAERIRTEPRYPLEAWEVEALIAGGPRPGAEVDAILRDALRTRGLGTIADGNQAA